MKASIDAYELIKQFEGLRLEAYLCPAGIWTIGYGHTSGVSPNSFITIQEADEYLHRDVATIEMQLNKLNLSLRQCQWDAIVSFVFNVGIGNFKASTLLAKIRINPDDNSIIDEFLRWVYANGKVMRGLQKRRLTEMKLYFSDKLK
ncbi:MAG: lysozyme [Bacteroidales bacterium]